MGGFKQVNWDDFRYFVSVARTGSLSGAARELEVEHSTVGRRLSALETSLGATLVLRGPDGVRLTALAERLVPLVSQVERAVADVCELVASETARVRVAVPSGLTRLFTPALASFYEAHPGVALDLVSGAVTADLNKGEADLAIRAGAVTGDELVVRKLCESGWSLYASPAYLERKGDPLSATDFEGHEFVGFAPELSKSVAAQWLAARASRATIVLRSREMTDMLEAVASGVGIGVLPCLLGDARANLERVTPEVVASHPLSLVYRREARQSANVRAVIELILRVFSEQADRISGAAP